MNCFLRREIWAIVVLAQVICPSALVADEVLIAREGVCIERWESSLEDVWTRKGVLIECAREKIANSGLAVSKDGIVYVGDKSGKVLKFDLTGKRLGEFACGCMPDQLCLSPNGKWLFISSLDGERGIYRYDLATGKGGRIFATDHQYRMMSFGPDGNLWTADRSVPRLTVLDVRSAEAKVVADLPVKVCTGSFTFTADGAKAVIPGQRSSELDLVTSKVRYIGTPGNPQMTLCACRVGNRIFAGDYATGQVFRMDDDASNEVASGLGGVATLVNVTEARQGVKFGKVSVAYKQPESPKDPDFERLSFNNPKAIVPLKSSFLEFFNIVDVDGDGQLDVEIRCGSKDSGWPWAGSYLYRNPTPKGVIDPDPVFPAPERDPKIELDWQTNWDWAGGSFADGTPVGEEVHYYTRQMFNEAIEAAGTRWTGHDVWGGNRYLRDLDGDGIDDLIIQTGDQDNSSWSNQYDEHGNWKTVQQRTFVYFLKGLGDGKFAEQKQITMENTLPVETYGGFLSLMVEDWDRDGDYDIVMIDFMDTITYFENVGSKTNFQFTSGRFLRNPQNERIHGEHCMSIALAVDWDRDGLKDIMTLEEDSRVGWYRNTGKMLNGMPAFDSIRYLRQYAGELTFGVLATPSVIDWDGDGDQDIVSGNSMGQIAFIENLSGPGVEKPKWAVPKLLSEPDGKPIRLIAGQGGSIQGPVEWKWGYSVVCAADWDGDGLPDIMANSIRGEIRWWKNIGTRERPKLDYARGVEVEWDSEQPEMQFGWLRPKKQSNPKEILTQWRTTPVMTDWNRDGLMDLLLVDQEGYLSYFERARDANGKLILKAPRRCLVLEDGQTPIVFCNWKEGYGGGRCKIATIDWNHDGKLDLLVEGPPNVHVFLQVGEKGGKWLFRNVGAPAAANLFNHNPQACACDFNGDGVDDILMSSLDGFFYYLQNPLSR